MASLSEFERVVRHSGPVRCKQTVFRAGDPFDSLYIARSGSFKSYRLHDDGTLHVTGFYLPGELMGMDGIKDGRHRSYIESLETGSYCQISLAALGQLMSINPVLVTKLLGDFNSEVSRAKDMMYLLGNMSTKQKLANFLLRFSDRGYRCGFSGDNIHLSLTRSDIANYLGMAPETVSRVFQRLRDQHIVQIKNRDIEIIDRGKLETIAAHGSCPMADSACVDNANLMADYH